MCVWCVGGVHACGDVCTPCVCALCVLCVWGGVHAVCCEGVCMGGEVGVHA